MKLLNMKRINNENKHLEKKINNNNKLTTEHCDLLLSCWHFICHVLVVLVLSNW